LSRLTATSSAYGPTLPSGWTLEATADFKGGGNPDYNHESRDGGTNEHESVHSAEGMILPTNHTNRRERNSGTRITKAFRVFGVFRGQIAY
jgi:hypothetical protein